jgi:nucleotide-binding universal stress UspA family protein
VPEDGSERAKALLPFVGDLARSSQARVVVLLCGRGAHDEEGAQRVREKIGSGLTSLDVRSDGAAPAAAVRAEASRQPCDLVLAARSATPGKEGLEEAEALLAAGSHHLLLLPAAEGDYPITRVLVGMAVGEPGKEDAAFAGRLSRHLGAEATLMTVLPETERSVESGESKRAARFLNGNRNVLQRLGVPVETRVRFGDPVSEIVDQMEEGGHDLLVLGTPLPSREGREKGIALRGVIARLIAEVSRHPILIVRSPEVKK